MNNNLESYVECNVGISKSDTELLKANYKSKSIIKSDIELLTEKTFNEFILKIVEKIREYMKNTCAFINNKICIKYDFPINSLFIIFKNCHPKWNENNGTNEWTDYVHDFIDIYKRTFCLSNNLKIILILKIQEK
jgi:hypothetical protein